MTAYAESHAEPTAVEANELHRDLATQMTHARRHDTDQRVTMVVPAQQMAQLDFPGAVADAAINADVDPEQLEFEIEEHDLHWRDDLEPTLQALTQMGARIAIDRFGTGLTSLSTLSHLPISTIKIDASIVAGALEDPDVANYARAMIDVARHLRIDVVALGATTSEQIAFFTGAGCATTQH
jgi:EAL domain-containing protein (putative c-di-GMP-specific phosphodiesterase class I)